ncbi:hypothetical protein [Ignicoccus hospitalis]|uniref:hypothetical protein n=1 Tax=Ignicoccus hospitalis TaxID=160233 RepID=UPI000325172D|nr:hypothetical protein [Ignicoccus hospitalis]HIH90105.1 hypothetical protein [Desulfurococcaceae archaeon]
MERPPAAYGLATVAALAVDPLAGSIAIIISLLMAYCGKRFGAWFALPSTLLAFLGAHLDVPPLALGSFLAALYLDPAISFAPLPFALIAAARAPPVSPLLGGYPSSVVAKVPTELSLAFGYLPLLQLGGVAPALGFLVGLATAPLLDFVSKLCPNGPMIKLSEPIFVGIGAGLMINVVRLRLRLIQGIKFKLAALRRGRAY